MILFTCGVNFQHELDDNDIPLFQKDFYPTSEEVKRKSKCWQECGIVKVFQNDKGVVFLIKWIEPQNFKWQKK